MSALYGPDHVDNDDAVNAEMEAIFACAQQLLQCMEDIIVGMLPRSPSGIALHAALKARDHAEIGRLILIELDARVAVVAEENLDELAAKREDDEYESHRLFQDVL